MLRCQRSHWLEWKFLEGRWNRFETYTQSTGETIWNTEKLLQPWLWWTGMWGSCESLWYCFCHKQSYLLWGNPMWRWTVFIVIQFNLVHIELNKHFIELSLLNVQLKWFMIYFTGLLRQVVKETWRLHENCNYSLRWHWNHRILRIGDFAYSLLCYQSSH